MTTLNPSLTLEDFMDFYKAETEEEILQFLKVKDMLDIKFWVPYGETESNFSIIGNQSSSAEKSLIEKMTNSVDAVLMEKCYECGIDPKSPLAPNSPLDALKEFYGITLNDSSELSQKNYAELSDQILLIATSKDCISTPRNSRVSPNMTILDYGEGQSPKTIPKTLLSLLSGNKKSIKFSQGNYNQGGSGSYAYCGEHGFALIISKRSPNIPNKFKDKNDDTLENWGWTLIRKEFRANSKDPIYTYYAPNGSIPTLSEESLPLAPQKLSSIEAKKYLDYNGACNAFIPYSTNVKHGTAIKLFNYKLAKKGPINGHLKYDLATFINDTYLPIHFIDCRKNKGSNNLYFRGFRKIIEQDEHNKKESEDGLLYTKINSDFKIGTQQVLIHIYCCNKRSSDKLTAAKLIEGANAIKFCLGQQFQGNLTKRFLNNAGLGAIQDLIIITIEFPNIETEFKSELFMTDRERLFEKKPKKEIEKKLKEIISNSDELKDFRNYIVNTSNPENLNEDMTIKEVLSDWIKEDPKITQLLNGTDLIDILGDSTPLDDVPPKPKINEPTDPVINEPIECFDIPSIFVPMLRKKEGQYYKVVYYKESFKIKFKFNTFDHFFENNSLDIYVNNSKYSNYSKIFKNGILTLIFPQNFAKATDLNKELKILIKTTDIQFEEIIAIEFKNRIVSPLEKERNLSLPNYILTDLNSNISGITEDTGVLYLKDMTDYIYYINMDNRHLIKKLNSLNDLLDKDLYKKLYIIKMLFLAMSENANSNPSNNENDETDTIKNIELVTKAYAKFMFISDQLTTTFKKKFGR